MYSPRTIDGETCKQQVTCVFFFFFFFFYIPRLYVRIRTSGYAIHYYDNIIPFFPVENGLKILLEIVPITDCGHRRVTGPLFDAAPAFDDAAPALLVGRRRIAIGRRRVPEPHMPDTAAATAGRPAIAPPALPAAAPATTTTTTTTAGHVHDAPPAQRRRAAARHAVRARRQSAPLQRAAAPPPTLPTAAAEHQDHDAGPLPQPQQSPGPFGRDTALAGRPTGAP